MSRKYREKDETKAETTAATFFKLTDLSRTFEVPYPLAVGTFLCHSIFYLTSIITRTYSDDDSWPFILQISSFLFRVQQQIGSYLQSTSCAVLVIILYTATLALYSFLVFSLKKRQSGLLSQTKCKTAFCLINYVCFTLIFPLTNLLTLVSCKQWTAMPAISVAGVVLLLLFYGFAWWSEEVTSWDLRRTGSLMTKIYSWNDGAIQVSKLAISNLSLLEVTNSSLLLIAILVGGAVMSLLELYQILFMPKYYHQRVQTLYSRKVLLECVVTGVSSLVLLVPDPLMVQNLFLFHLVLFLFSTYTLNVYLKQRRGDLMMRLPSEVKTSEEAVTFVVEMIKLALNKQSRAGLKPYLIVNHLKQCESVHCCCNQLADEDITKVASSTNILHQLILQMLDQIRSRFPRSIPVLSLVTSFKMTLNPSFSRAKQALEQLNNHLTIYHKYLVFQLNAMIDNQVGSINEAVNSLPLELVIKESATAMVLKENLSGIVDSMIEKYRLMGVEFLRLNEVAVINNKANACISTIEDLWEVHSRAVDNYNIEQDFLYLFYFEALLPSLRQARELQRMLVRKIKRLLNIKGLFRKNSFVAMYSRRTCILESVLEAKFGTVTNASKSVAQVLGLDKGDLIGLDIHNAMPAFFAKGHRQRLQEWFRKESFEMQNVGLTDCFTADAKHVAFSGYSYLKVHSDGACLKAYKMIVRDNDQDYLVVGKTGTIEALGSRLTELGLFSKQQLGLDVTSLVDSSPLFWGGEAQEKKQTVMVPICRASMVQSCESVEQVEGREGTAFQCLVGRRKIQMGDSFYFVVQFLEVRQGTSTPAPTNFHFRQELKSMKTLKDAGDDEAGNGASEEGEEGYMFGESSSCQTVSGSKKGEYSKVLLQLKGLLCNPSSVTLKWRCTISTVLVSILIAGMVGIYFEREIILTGFTSFAHVLQSSIDISRLNQLLQQLYNYALVSKTSCPLDQQRCQQLRTLSQPLLRQLYSHYQQYCFNYFQDVTSPIPIKVAGSFNQMHILTVGSELQQASLTSKEVIESVIKWLMTVLSDPIGDADLESAHLLLSLNWPTLKQLGKSVSAYNAELAEFELDSIKKMLTVLLTVAGFIGGVVFLAFYNYFNYRDAQKASVLALYRRVGRQDAVIMLQYFQRAQQAGGEQAQQARGELQYPNIEGEHTHEGVISYDKTNNINTMVPVLLVLGTPSFVLLLLTPILMFFKAQATLDFTSSLIRAENNLTESWLELKTFYLGDQWGNSQSQMESEVLGRLNSTEAEIGCLARTTVPYFKSEDQSFQSQLNSLLVTNVCDLTALHLSPQEKERCGNLSILNRGVLSGANFLQRNTLKALLHLSTTHQVDNASYFNTTLSQTIDDSLPFISLVHHTINTLVVDSFSQQVRPSADNIGVDLILTCVTCMVVALIWFSHARKESRDYSDLCGYCCQLPEWLMVKKHVLRESQSVLDLLS